MAVDQIEREVQIAAPIERVWALVTEADHLGTWFGDAGAEIDLRPGGALLLRWERWGSVRGRVEAVEAPRRVAFRWLAGAGRDEEPAPGNSTLVEFTLRADGPGTVLRVVETGFAGLDLDEREREERRLGNVDGWRMELDELAAYAAERAAR